MPAKKKGRLDAMTLSEHQAMMPGNYFVDRIPYAHEEHTDASYGILADAFGKPKPSMIAAEDDLMLRTTVLSKCGRVPNRVREVEMRAKMNARQEPLPRAAGNKGTPLTEYMHRSCKACMPVPTITNDRIADPSILLRDPLTAVAHMHFYNVPSDTNFEARDAFKRCERLQPRQLDSI